jgi:hypothetical protein
MVRIAISVAERKQQLAVKKFSCSKYLADVT